MWSLFLSICCVVVLSPFEGSWRFSFLVAGFVLSSSKTVISSSSPVVDHASVLVVQCCGLCFVGRVSVDLRILPCVICNVPCVWCTVVWCTVMWCVVWCVVCHVWCVECGVSCAVIACYQFLEFDRELTS